MTGKAEKKITAFGDQIDQKIEEKKIREKVSGFFKKAFSKKAPQQQQQPAEAEDIDSVRETLDP